MSFLFVIIMLVLLFKLYNGFWWTLSANNALIPVTKKKNTLIDLPNQMWEHDLSSRDIWEYAKTKFDILLQYGHCFLVFDMHGNIGSAINLSGYSIRRKKKMLIPMGFSFIGVLYASRNAGLVKEGRELFSPTFDEHNISLQNWTQWLQLLSLELDEGSLL